jgi:TolB-like protein/Tfp pilus assembly protein PilF
MGQPNKAVFLSYASQDAEAARRICDALRAAGIEVWFDQSELRGGDVWDQTIRRHIRDCELFLPIISANTQARPEGYFRLEWRLAEQRTHLMGRIKAFIVPICVDNTPEKEADVPDSFMAAQWSRLPSGDTSPAFVERILRLLSPDQYVSAVPAHVAAGPAPSSADGQSKIPRYAVASWRRKPALLLMAAAVIIGVGYVAVNRFVPLKRRADVERVAPNAQLGAPAQSAIPEKSIAILPFVDMSEKKDQEYFSDGLSEELIDLLAKGTDMRVAARTSAFSFKGREATIPEIAKALGVANVLEGSVRKSGKTLRITAQLIRAGDGYHVWSESYDRHLTDIFKIQDEIAAAVVAALKSQMSGAQSASAHRTANTDAYNEYLLGKQAYRTPTVTSLTSSVEAFRRAVSLDPNYAAAYAALADSQAFLAVIRSQGHLLNSDMAFKHALEDTTRAITLNPELAEGYSARGMTRIRMFDWTGAETDLRKAVELDPRDATARRRYGRVLADIGRLSEAIATERLAIKEDPLDSYAAIYLSQFLLAAGQLDDARTAAQRAKEITPNLIAEDEYGPLIDLVQGKPTTLLTFAQTIHENESLRLADIAIATHALDRDAESNEALAKLIADFSTTAPVAIAQVYAWRGDRDHALEWLARARDLGDVYLEHVKLDVAYSKLRDEPRFKELLRKMNLPE